MGDIYRKGSHYVTCDRTGLKTRVEDVRREYTGAYVRKDWYEPRHPQDQVRSRRGMEGGAVSPSRSEPTWQFGGASTTVLSAAVAAYALVILVEKSTDFSVGNSIGVLLSDSEQFHTTVDAVATGQLTIHNHLPRSAALGALVTNYSAISVPDLG